MKRLSKILAPILAIIMTSSLLLVPSLASEANDPYAQFKEGTGYVAIGDSFTRGYGAGEHWQDQIYLSDSYGNFNCRNVDGSYPKLISEAFGLNTPDDIRDKSATMWPIAHDAVSTAYILDLLGIDDGYRDEEFTYDQNDMQERYATDLAYFGDPQSYTVDGTSTYNKTGEVMSVHDLIKDAGLITIGLGQTDVIYKAQTFGLNTLDFNDIASLPAGIKNIIDLLDKYFDYWIEAYPLILDFIKENNPDATVVLVGTLNPIKNATLTDDISIRIGSIINGIMDKMNAYTKYYAMKYDYLYVDISDVDTPSSVTQMSIGQILSISDSTEYALIAHPTPNGYSQIAEKIIDAVDKDLAGESSSWQDNIARVKDFFFMIIQTIRIFFSNLFNGFGA